MVYLCLEIIEVLPTYCAYRSIAFDHGFSDVLLSPSAFRTQPDSLQVEDILPDDLLVFCCIGVAEFSAHVLLGLHVRWHHQAYFLCAKGVPLPVLLTHFWYAYLVFASNPVCNVPPYDVPELGEDP